MFENIIVNYLFSCVMDVTNIEYSTYEIYDISIILNGTVVVRTREQKLQVNV